MMVGRVAAIVMARKNAYEKRNGKKTPRRRPSEEELERFKKQDCKIGTINKVERVIQGHDIMENSLTRLRFRKIPWPFWIIGALFQLSAIVCLYFIYIFGPDSGHDLFIITEGR